MAKCWTCGTHVSGYHYTCSSCESLTEIKSLQRKVEFHGRDISERFDYMVRAQQEGFEALSDAISAGLSGIASAIEWGFEEINWQFQQQTDVLRSIDHTLKTPGETQANEWRKMAEELRLRGVLDESKEFYLKALELNRLDYRIYVGLAESYLQGNEFNKAKTFLEKSLPHAPKQKIDYKSYSYRLIGHIQACEEDYNQAVSTLRSSIELSPTYEDGHYDYAQYCAQMSNPEKCLSSLRKAILTKPLYWYLAHKERNFDPIRNEVEKLLSNLRTEASLRAKDAIAKSENALKEAHEAVSKAEQALSASRDKSVLNSSTMCENTEAKLKLAKDKVASGDYVAFLETTPIADESCILANNAVNTAGGEREHYQRRRAERVKNARKRVPGVLIKCSLLFGVIGALGGSTIYFMLFSPSVGTTDVGFIAGFFVGLVIGLIFGIYKSHKEIQKELE